MRLSNKLRYNLFKAGFVFICAAAFLMIHTFFVAFVNPDKIVTVTINEQNESWVEFIVILVFFPVIVYLLYVVKCLVLPALKDGRLDYEKKL